MGQTAYKLQAKTMVLLFPLVTELIFLPCDIEVATHFPAILQQLGVEKMKYICLKNKK